MDIVPWPRGEQEKNMPSFVGDKLNFLKLGSALVGFSGGELGFLEANTSN